MKLLSLLLLLLTSVASAEVREFRSAEWIQVFHESPDEPCELIVRWQADDGSTLSTYHGWMIPSKIICVEREGGVAWITTGAYEADHWILVDNHGRQKVFRYK
jgi:hypothetical protein